MDITLERILSLIPRKANGEYVHGEKKKFAESIGLRSGNLISDWIEGRSASYKNYVYQIAEIYHVSVEWLKGESEEKEKPATEVTGDERYNLQKEVVKRLSRLSIQNLIKTLGYMDSLIETEESK